MNEGDRRQWHLEWPTSRGGHVGRAVLKSRVEDFLVDEALSFGNADVGEHLCLRIEKTGDNTDYVARQLAAMAGTRHFDVGFCGLKDRHAITRQWFSIYRPGLEGGDLDFIEQVTNHWQVLDSRRYFRKLRRGDHQGNRFEIVLREVDGNPADIDQAFSVVRDVGCPNYFGPQRFGHGGANLDEATRLDPANLNLGGSRGSKKRGRRQPASGGRDSKNVLYFSAARSWLFNEVLARRVREDSWRRVLDGEPDSGEGEATGPLWGDGGTLAESLQGELEHSVVAGYPELKRLFSVTRMKPERRSLVLKPKDFSWQWLSDNTVEVSFILDPGQYATTLLGDVFDLVDASAGA